MTLGAQVPALVCACSPRSGLQGGGGAGPKAAGTHGFRTWGLQGNIRFVAKASNSVLNCPSGAAARISDSGCRVTSPTGNVRDMMHGYAVPAGVTHSLPDQQAPHRSPNLDSGAGPAAARPNSLTRSTLMSSTPSWRSNASWDQLQKDLDHLDDLQRSVLAAIVHEWVR